MTVAVKPRSIRCAIYTRKSSEEGLEQDFNSLDAQREACGAYVLSQAGEGWWALSDIYDDGGISGATMERPALKRLLADIEGGRIDVVVVYKIDRLTRSLADFARIVEVFDKAGSSFVSVTQAFNTTTSMGRLTLNVLLSFAQFEREVTGERIRDKIAASKKKGMWMGGAVPLGYEPDGRTLSVNEAEAQIVRDAFTRYLEIGSVHLLRAELEAKGIRSKARVTKAGKAVGGEVFRRGALFHILSNRLYLGEVPHKGQHYPGLHKPIVDQDIFDQAQLMLARHAGPKRRRKSGLQPLAPAAPLRGLIWDDRGNRMSPVSARKGQGSIYRYYVSTARQQGRPLEAGSLARAPAIAVEHMVIHKADELGIIPTAEIADADWLVLREALDRIEVAKSYVRISFRRSYLERGGRSLEDLDLPADTTKAMEIQADVVVFKLSTTLSRRGQHKVLAGPGNGTAEQRTEQPDPSLLRALVQAEAWKRRLLTRKSYTVKEIAKAEGVRASHCERIIRMAFLAPDLKRAILEGRAPAGLMLERLKETGIPDSWADQRDQVWRT